ncbi:MAG: diguanylate cyclase, partial [Candidatus Obscuribacterales bacterium]|nr:diguanylate cyclase [Candidatus Obscuribacterales bacterium]
VTDTLDSLIIQGVQLLDKLNLIRTSGFKEDSVLYKTNEKMSQVDLETMLSVGEPHHLELQRRLYAAINNETPFDQIAEELSLTRSQWVPILSHLFRCRLISIGGTMKGSATGGMPALVPKTVDSAAVQSVMMALRRPDTGMFNYPAFLYFLEQEYFRAHRAGAPLSIIIFEMRIKSGVKEIIREPLPSAALADAVLRITTTKRHNDLLAHYEGFDYALLCPDTKGEGARIFANRIVDAIMKESLSNNFKQEALSLSFGVAAIPEDFLELGLLLSAAETARNHSVETDTPVVLYRDLI